MKVNHILTSVSITSSESMDEPSTEQTGDSAIESSEAEPSSSKVSSDCFESSTQPSSSTNSVVSRSGSSLDHSESIESVGCNGAVPDEQRRLSAQQRAELSQTQYNNIASGIRFIILLICVAWCLFETCIIIAEYWNYDTVVYLDYPQPNLTKPPAITICTHCILCQFGESISDQGIATLFNDNYLVGKTQAPPFNSTEMQKDVDISCIISFRQMYTNSTGASSNKEMNCTDLVPTVKSIQEGHKCFTYFSDLEGQVSRIIGQNEASPLMFKFDQFPQITFTVAGLFVFGVAVNSYDIKPSNSTVPPTTTFTGMYMNVHDPTILPDMYNMAFHQVVPGKSTNVPFVKRVQKLLPSPYKTKCFDYNSSSNQLANITERFGFRVLSKSGQAVTSEGLGIYSTRGECFLYCMWRLLNSNARCINFYSIFTENIYHDEVNARAIAPFDSIDNSSVDEARLVRSNVTITDFTKLVKMCAKTDQEFLVYIQTKHQCLKACPDSCLVETFSEENIIDENQTSSSTTATIRIQWAPKAIISIVHRPKLDTPEFLGTLGGQAHIWLGISVIQIIWYVVRFVQSVEILPDTSCCALIHYWKNFSTKQTKPHSNEFT